jgi:predicted transglutaminase-like cysteine proteinase
MLWRGPALRIALLLCVIASTTHCGPPPALMPDATAPKAAPRGYIALCTRDPAFCDGKGPTSVALTHGRWGELLRVNDGVNGLLKPTENPDGRADWSVPTGALRDAEPADCKNYVLAKKEKLVDLGWPKSALRIGIVTYSRKTPNIRHAVLLADTSDGIFVLDNLQRTILRWTEAPYSWVSVQVSTDPDRWEGVRR